MDANNVVIKITDFGLCRTTNVDYEYISEQNTHQLPFRWTAIECYNSFTKVLIRFFFNLIKQKYFSLLKKVIFGHLVL